MPLDQLPEPPSAPEMKRHIRFHPYQWVGLALVSVVPLLAAFGVFGETWSSVRGASAELEVTVRYPERYRYKQLNAIEVILRNVSPGPLDTVSLSLDTAFASRFSTVRAIPAFVRAYEVEVTDLAPGEERLVVIEIQAEQYGAARGSLSAASSAAPDTVRVPLYVRVFP